MAGQSSKKNILLVLMSLVFLVIAYFVFSKYVFDSAVPTLNINLVNSENTEANVAKINGKIKNIMFIKNDIFDNEKFLNLKEQHYKKIKLESYKKGKINPFEAKTKKKLEKISGDLQEGSGN